MVGQAISRRGEPGGEYIVAAKVSDAAPAPCLEPTRMDTLGLISEGTELSKTCMLQEVLRDYNALTAEWEYRFLVNYSDLEVCTSSNPHPDRALLVRSFPQPGSVENDTFCYTGNGAALNDINGEERDPNGIYYGGENYCHMLWSNSYEVPAAKRPATRSFPAPGSVRTNTPILWRPVNPNLNIANGQEAVGD